MASEGEQITTLDEVERKLTIWRHAGASILPV